VAAPEIVIVDAQSIPPPSKSPVTAADLGDPVKGRDSDVALPRDALTAAMGDRKPPVPA